MEAEVPRLGRACPPKAKERNRNQTNKPTKEDKKRKSEKLTKTAQTTKRRQACLYIYTYEHTAHPRTPKLSKQHVPNFYIHAFES